ncbi:DUF5677 domain-containing protein [Dinghuibacter silviterrae]|uniref:DUF5677 domain-containing protein n=1 Tax=Dinghuibacter silviterrae TaxID=1539049 RepID=UPI0010627F0A|nr:DUF5677 domain-containing protein [Dinghuibacter silviterrae]
MEKGIEYTYDREGNVARTVKMDSETREAALGAIGSYQEIFDREAVDDDPLFLEMTLYSEEEIMEKSEEALKYAYGVPDEDLYAFRKLGFIVKKGNRKNVPDKDLLAWDEARKEYFDLFSGKIREEVDLYTEFQNHLENWVIKLIHLYALILYKSEAEFKSTHFYEELNMKSYTLFCLTKHLKTMKATRPLTSHYFNEDTFSLIRTMYENYLQISTIVHYPVQMQKELDAKVGLYLGTHKQEYDCIIDVSSGSKTKIISNKQRAMLDKDFRHENTHLYFTLYGYLSNFIHPDIRVVGHFFKDGYLSHNANKDQITVFYYINLVNVMLLFDLLKSSIFDGQNQKDIKNFTIKVTELLLTVSRMSNDGGDSIIQDRLQKMLSSSLLQ